MIGGAVMTSLMMPLSGDLFEPPDRCVTTVQSWSGACSVVPLKSLDFPKR
jgi:hypothetical protein